MSELEALRVAMIIGAGLVSIICTINHTARALTPPQPRNDGDA